MRLLRAYVEPRGDCLSIILLAGSLTGISAGCIQNVVYNF